MKLNMETLSLLERQELKNKTDKFYAPSEIIELFESKDVDKEWSFIEYKPSDTSKLTHCYHRYPAKFIPQLVEKLMDEYISGIKEPLVNDLFMGSGTTIACAITRGYRASGTDINYISELITRVKSTPINPAMLREKIEELLADLSFLESDTLFSNHIKPYIPKANVERIDYWFKPEIKEELGIILAKVKEEPDINIQNFFTVCFSHILKTVSIWLMGSTKPTRDFNKKIQQPIFYFKRHLKKMERKNKEFWTIVPSHIKNNLDLYLNIKRGNAKNQPVDDEAVDIQITSSPYVTSYEYADLHQLSTLWLEYAVDLSEYRKEFIGTAYKRYEDRQLKSKIAQSIVNQMLLKDKNMSKEIEAFFIDMQECFDETYRILRPGGRCCYVIGNTMLKKVEILNAEVFAESIQNSGLIVDRIIKREIPSKILPQKRDAETGKFAKNGKEDFHAYPMEYIVIGRKI
ncbi:MAG: site-specific DNA-methyltransferase [Nitrospira sp.]|nr:site-specific DNA-methyltransferase [Nitrospira sp.]